MSSFQSRYRAASHFRVVQLKMQPPGFASFNLVIERLLISGGPSILDHDLRATFQSRYRAASHFREMIEDAGGTRYLVSISLSSGFSFQEALSDGAGAAGVQVSISLSSGFSFQAVRISLKS